MDWTEDLKKTAKQLTRRGYGILAADESVGTIGKRLVGHGLKNDEETRRRFRDILLTAPGNEEALSGVILFHETVYQRTVGGEEESFVEHLTKKGILVGVKVDTGLRVLEGSERETWTSGLEGLRERCRTYRESGARFAKWRAALRIDVKEGLPSERAVRENAGLLAKYAKIAQEEGLVAIVEPEMLLDGDYSMEESGREGGRVMRCCYEMLREEGVVLEGTLLKVMMALPGLSWEGREKMSAETIGRKTVEMVRDSVPREVGGVMFLSGGMSEEEATRNLNAVNVVAETEYGGMPWALSFSFGRALQTSPLEVWGGKEENVERAKESAGMLARGNGRAQLGLFGAGERHASVGAGRSLYEGFRGWSGPGSNEVK